MAERKNKTFGIDAATHQLVLGRLRLPLPQSRILRISIGVGLTLLGCLGFLPVLGFWMIPLGLLVLSHDLSFVRRQRRRLTVWWARRSQPNA